MLLQGRALCQQAWCSVHVSQTGLNGVRSFTSCCMSLGTFESVPLFVKWECEMKWNGALGLEFSTQWLTSKCRPLISAQWLLLMWSQIKTKVFFACDIECFSSRGEWMKNAAGNTPVAGFRSVLLQENSGVNRIWVLVGSTSCSLP